MLAYHYTPKKNLRSILAEGLLPNQDITFTESSFVEDLEKVYGMRPIHFGMDKDTWETGDRENYVLLEVNIDGLETAADFGSLIDKGMIYEMGSESFYFEGEEVDYTFDDLFYGEYKERLIEKTNTLVVMENISPDRIRVIE